MIREERRPRILNGLDAVILFCLCVLVFFLPIAHTESIRSFSFLIPVGLWVIKMILERQWLMVRTPLDIPLALFTVCAALSLTTAVDVRYSGEEFVFEWLAGLLLFYLAASNLRPPHMKYVLGALLLGNLLMVNYGLYDFFHRGGHLLDYSYRAGSLHSGFSAFGTYLVTVLPYLLVAAFYLPSTGARICLGVLILLNVAALYLTHTRGVWIAAALLLFLTGWRFLPKIPVLLVAGGVALLVFFFAPKEVLQHHTEITPAQKETAALETMQARKEVTRFSLEKIRETPWRMLGYGRRSFVKQFGDFHEKYSGAQLWHAHNTFLNIALQTGIQGLAFFIFLLYKLMRYVYAGAKLCASPLAEFFLLATGLMIVGFFVRNLSDDFFVDDAALLFWFLTGGAVSLGRSAKTAGRKE